MMIIERVKNSFGSSFEDNEAQWKSLLSEGNKLNAIDKAKRKETRDKLAKL